jgi:hypothetical protein
MYHPVTTNLADTYKLKYLTISLHYYIELSSHIDSLKQNSTPIEFQIRIPLLMATKVIASYATTFKYYTFVVGTHFI